MSKNRRRVILSGSDDAAGDLLAARALLVDNPLLDDEFEPFALGVDANYDDLVDKGFRPDDLLVLMLGDEYGSVVSEGKSFEQLLFEQAGDANVPRHVFVKSTESASARQRQFLKLIDCTVVRARYTTTDEAVRGLFVTLCSLKFGPVNPLGEIGVVRSLVPIPPPPVARPKEQDGGMSVAKVCGAIAGGIACASGVGIIGSLLLAGVGAIVGSVFSGGEDIDGDGSVEDGEVETPQQKKVRQILDQQADSIHLLINPRGVDETFKFKVTMDDIDSAKLAPFVEAENRYLGWIGKDAITALDYLKKHGWADADGNIYDSAFAAFGKVAADSYKPEKPRLRVGQLEEHKRVCDEIAVELELWRIACFAKFKETGRSNVIVEPSVHRLCRRINDRHAGEEDWKNLSESKITRNLESALGVKIDVAKIISRHAGKRPGEDGTRRGEQIARKFGDYGRADICLLWAGLSRRNVGFAKESQREIAIITKALKTDLAYRRAVEVVCRRWV